MRWWQIALLTLMVLGLAAGGWWYFRSPESYAQLWRDRVEAALASKDCPTAGQNKFPSGAYTGPLIDTHIHIAHIPDSEPGTPVQTDGKHPLMGHDITIADYACMMETEGTAKVFAFFPVWDPIAQPLLDIVQGAVKKYPNKFVTFIMPPDGDNDLDGFPTVTADKLTEFLAVYPKLFRGYGEIGLYERGDEHGARTGAAALPPDAERLTDIYPVVRANKLLVYFHPGFDQKDNFRRALAANPDINFVFHGGHLIGFNEEKGERLFGDLEEILSNHPNAFYGVDELYGGEWLLHPDVSKEKFLAHFADPAPLLEKDLKTWQKVIENHPDQVIYGTDRGWSSSWSVDPLVATTLTNYNRLFIGRLDPAVQAKFAYQNAEKLIAHD